MFFFNVRHFFGGVGGGGSGDGRRGGQTGQFDSTCWH